MTKKEIPLVARVSIESTGERACRGFELPTDGINSWEINHYWPSTHCRLEIAVDDDGVLVIPREHIAKVLYLAEIILDRDQAARAGAYKKAGLKPDDTLGKYKEEAR